MGAYRIANSIILPHIRYVNHRGPTCIMFHSEVVRVNGKYQTLGCDKMDVSGFCLGHKMSREEFLKRYCGEIETGIKKARKKRIKALRFKKRT